MYKTQHPIRGYLLIATATLLWGGSATLGKAAFTGLLAGSQSGPPIDSLILAQTRTTISLIFLFPIIALWRGREAVSLPYKDVLRCMLLGVLGLVGSNFFYYYAIEKTSVATAIILQYAAPVWVLLYMVARGFQRATKQRVSAVALAVAGSILAIGVVSVTASAPFVSFAGIKLHPGGVIAALLAGLSFSFYNVFGSTLLSRYNRWKVLIFALLGAAIFWMFVNPPWKVLAANYSKEQWLFLIVFAITSMLLPFSCYFAGLQHLDPTRAIVTSCLEPVFAILFAATFVHEAVGWVQAFGILIVLVSTILIQLPEKISTVTSAQHA